MTAGRSLISIAEVNENVDHVIAALEGIRLAVVEASSDDANAVNWSALAGLVDIAQSACSPLLELAGNLHSAGENQKGSEHVVVLFEPGEASEFRRRLTGMRGVK